MDRSFTATGRTYSDEINALPAKAPDVTDRIMLGVKAAVRAAFDALEVTDHGLDREFRARVIFLEDGSFALTLKPGEAVAREVESPDVAVGRIAEIDRQAQAA